VAKSTSIPEVSAARALDYVSDGQVVGLGSGRAAAAFVRLLAERVRSGWQIRGVPTSEGTAALARELGIPLVDLNSVDTIDVAVDGADEVEPQKLDLIKGLGGAMLRERVIAWTSKKWIVVVGADKLVTDLGARGVLPVEVVKFALGPCQRRLVQLGLAAKLREFEHAPFVTDNGNYVLDCHVAALQRPEELDRQIRAIPGVVETGFFFGFRPTVLVQNGSDVKVLEPSD
jgi:ribose 5-phosphate isomerase A